MNNQSNQPYLYQHSWSKMFYATICVQFQLYVWCRLCSDYQYQTSKVGLSVTLPFLLVSQFTLALPLSKSFNYFIHLRYLLLVGRQILTTLKWNCVIYFWYSEVIANNKTFLPNLDIGSVWSYLEILNPKTPLLSFPFILFHTSHSAVHTLLLFHIPSLTHLVLLR